MTRTPLAAIQKGRTNLWKIPPTKVSMQPGFNSRSIDYSLDPEEVAKLDPELEELTLLVAEHGIRIPCIGAMADGKFRLTDGHRRTCALRLAIARGLLKKNDPRSLVPVLPEPSKYGEGSRLLDVLVLNTGKRLDILEQAGAFVRLMDDHQYDEKMISSRTGASITHIRNSLLLKRGAHPELLAAIARDEIAATTAIELVREIPDTDAQLAALTQARENADGNRITPKHLPVAVGRIKHQQTREAADVGEGEGARPSDLAYWKWDILAEEMRKLIRKAYPDHEEDQRDAFDYAFDSADKKCIDRRLGELPVFDGKDTTPDTAITDGDNTFVSGWAEFPLELPAPKSVGATILIVEEKGTFYYGITLKWPRLFAGDGFLHEKPQRIGGHPTRDAIMLVALQRVRAELETREFKNHELTMQFLDGMIQSYANRVDPTTTESDPQSDPAPALAPAPAEEAFTFTVQIVCIAKVTARGATEEEARERIRQSDFASIEVTPGSARFEVFEQ